LRSFIAIELPLAIRSALAELQQELKMCNADIRWVKPDNIHLTLKFLGEVKEGRIDGIVKGNRDVCGRYGRLRLEVRGLGVFPNRRSPRVLWVDVTGDGMLAGLQRDIEGAMALEGFKKEKRGYTPHLTMGRFRSLREKDHLFERIDQLSDNSLGFMDVKSVALMRSDLGPAGAEYTRIAELPLSG
jgi:2'-5' RNA ligase